MQPLNAAHDSLAEIAAAGSGMRVEGADVLHPGSVLFRFVQRADVSDTVYLASPWWFQRSAVRVILQAARSGHRGTNEVAEQARRMAALSRTWGRSGAHYLLAAKVAAPVIFYWGAPKPVGLTSPAQPQAGGLSSGQQVAAVEFVPDPRCVQLYLPGMGDQRLSSKALRASSRTKFTHSVDLANGDIEVFLQGLTA